MLISPSTSASLGILLERFLINAQQAQKTLQFIAKTYSYEILTDVEQT